MKFENANVPITGVTSDKTFKGIPFGFHFIRFWQAILPTAS